MQPIHRQGQANKWVRRMEEAELRIVDLKSKDMLREIENGIVYGMPVLLQDVLEELAPALEPVLAKALIKVGNREVLRLGDKELDYNQEYPSVRSQPFALSLARCQGTSTKEWGGGRTEGQQQTHH